MRRLARIGAIVLVLLAVAVALGYWSGAREPIDVLAAGRAKLGTDLRARMVPTNGVRLHVVEAGPVDGPPVVLLHGFPEFWWAWNEQIKRLAAAGFRVIVPDQRGYHLSDKPAGVESYQMSALTDDIVGLIRQLGYEQVNLAGHDWGGAVAWHLALRHPEYVRRLVMFNSPHPLAFSDLRAANGNEESIGWFRTFFQLPWLPEVISRFGGWYLIAANVRGTARPGTFSDAEMDLYKQAWAQPGAYHGMVNWYRAGFTLPSKVEGDGMVEVPTRIVWGMKDPFFPRGLGALSAKRCRQAELVELPEASHWLLHEEPEITSRQMIEFYGQPADSAGKVKGEST